ncbi:FtsX-like permease family protein [Saccharothrix longispora]|uniref:FtsX-like permease family protein n=1 Tax=Saccharothrix longispora TaxID=33920 RepID=UPI0028FD601B|nr:FtsX-like permease family protein [Saccharothrix longispora]MDU0290715.1 FtsX-like permease family protein [Saccharothrix longispora]
MRSWLSDLALGVRLALGGGRTSWVRLALTGAGIGIGVAVLLAASSVTTILGERDARAAAASAGTVESADGRDALYREFHNTEYRGETVSGWYVLPEGANPPVPPGMSRVPADGEVFLSPELAELLASPGGELLRERFPQRVVGTIGVAGLNSPHDLLFYAGDADVDPEHANTVVAFGEGELRERTLDPVLTLLVMVGVVALLFPVLVFVGISTRLAGAERDRRLAALRLVGAGSQRVRRIAAGEALLGAFTGMVVGVALFLVGRLFVEDVRLVGISVFRSDFTPSPWFVALVLVLVPVLAVVTSVVAMRRTVVEPLGVVRRTKPVRRVLWWRTLPILLGSAALLTQSDTLGGERSSASEPLVIGGIVMLLLGIPALLPWVVERAVGRLRGGAPSWQLAIRRLQLESGTAARVVGGVAVVLAGGIALQSVLASAESEIVDRPIPEADKSRVVVTMRDATPGTTRQAVDLLERSVGVAHVHPLGSVQFTRGPEDYQVATVGTCEALRTRAVLPTCRDGDSFYVVDPPPPGGGNARDTQVEPGERVRITEGYDDDEKTVAEWTIPRYTEVRPDEESSDHGYGLLLTPSVLGDLPATQEFSRIVVLVDPAQPDVAEHVRNALAPLTWHAYVSYFGETGVSERVEQYQGIRQGLLAGSLVTLLLASASLLVLALEQVRERRRPLAVLAAGGVPRGALGRSLLWQNAVPLLLALVVAVSVGGGMAVLLLRIISQPIVLDWAGIALLTGAAALLVVAVTVASLPSLRRATGALGLRSE